MTNATSTSNPSFIVEVGKAYPYPSHVIAPNFVTMKLSSKDTYNVWETQILCLLKSHQMYGFIDGQFLRPAGNGKGKVEDLEAWIISDSLVKGWILGSLSKEAVNKAVNHLTREQNNTDFTAKDLWDELRRSYGPSAASTSNPSFIVDVGEAYPYPSHVSAPNFVTMKLSGKDTYNVWVTQILCLLWSQNMVGFVEDEFPSPAGNGKGKDIDAWIASDSLVKGWILGSLSDGVAKKFVNRLNPIHKNTYFTAKDLWDELQRSYGPSDRKQTGVFDKILALGCSHKTYNDMKAWIISDSLVKRWILGSHSEEAVNKVDSHLTHKQKNPDFTAKDLWDKLRRIYGPSVREQAAETKVTTRQAESLIEVNSVSEIFEKAFWKKMIYRYIRNGRTNSVLYLLKETGCTPLEQITNNRDTVLHVAVGSATKHYELFKKLLEMTPENTVLDHKNHNGNTLLHVAAIVGSTKHIDMLVKRNPELLLVKDGAGQTPLALSISSMDTKVSRCLAQHMKEKGYGDHFPGKSREELVLLAISLKDFSLANMIINDYPDAIRYNSAAVLTALAQNFPPELKFWERRGDFEEIQMRLDFYLGRLLEFSDSTCWRWLLLIVCLLLIGLCVLPALFYHILKVLVRRFVGDKFHIQKDAKVLLFRVCDSLTHFKDNSSDYHHYYTNSIFEATRRNASTFIRCVMEVFPDAICTTNEDGHNFIQYSVINRSEKIYNLLYEMSEHKNIYKTIKDYSGNNLLHLAARLAPTNKLNLISGAALQIQRELQWFKAVERFVCPLNRIQENSDDETPEMIFTKEHKNLVNEGENWIKKTAESYTITAALIITIVFAAAITVPGGNNQESGIPIFTNNIAFKVFAISDAISLFTAVTSLLLFLSILTARFAEQDFLHKLPMKLIIGLTMLFLSTTAMIIAFGATLFLVFGQSNLLMLIPIGALTCLPITSFVTLQFPLIVDLVSSTYCGGIFVRERYDYFY